MRFPSSEAAVRGANRARYGTVGGMSRLGASCAATVFLLLQGASCVRTDTCSAPVAVTPEGTEEVASGDLVFSAVWFQEASRGYLVLTIRNQGAAPVLVARRPDTYRAACVYREDVSGQPDAFGAMRTYRSGTEGSGPVPAQLAYRPDHFVLLDAGDSFTRRFEHSVSDGLEGIRDLRLTYHAYDGDDFRYRPFEGHVCLATVRRVNPRDVGGFPGLAQ